MRITGFTVGLVAVCGPVELGTSLRKDDLSTAEAAGPFAAVLRGAAAVLIPVE